MAERANEPSGPETLLWERVCRSEQETLALGMSLGEACRGGEIFLVEGELGAGKTCLANGLAQGLGIEEPTASPTFVLLRSYIGSRGLTLHHLDFYRLTGESDLGTIGLDDCFGDKNIIYVEWPNRIPGAFENWTLRLNLDALDENTRRIKAYAGIAKSI